MHVSLHQLNHNDRQIQLKNSFALTNKQEICNKKNYLSNKYQKSFQGLRVVPKLLFIIEMDI